MYAGQLLFQNGAFQDAITAFQHNQILQIQQNSDVFLTLAKTFFLTGKFTQAQQNMSIANKLNKYDCQIEFDAKIMKFTDLMVKQVNSGKIKQTYKSFIQQLELHFKVSNNQQLKHLQKEKHYGKIFRQMDFYLFNSLILLYSGDSRLAVENFQKLLQQKRKSIIFDDNAETNQSFLQNKREQDFQKISHELKIYTNQMKFNIVLCYLHGGDIDNAKQILKDIKVQEKQSFYADFVKFKNSVLTDNFNFEKEEVFPNKNKLSQFLPPLTIFIKSKKNPFKMKLCIPFPKVQPPEIFPIFDVNLLKSLTIYGIEGKPEAPWIVKQDDVIKFTERMEYVSRLDFNDSEPSSSVTAIIDLSESKVSSKNKMTKKQPSQDRSSLFSKRTLKKKNSAIINF